MHEPAARLLLDTFGRQAEWCAGEGASPFCAQLLRLSRDWLAATPAALQAVAAVHPEPLAGAVTMRWLGALHHLALRGLEPWAALWPSTRPPASPPADDATLTAAIAQAWHTQRAALDAALARPPQTNEVGRSAALLPGLLQAAALLQRPLQLAEIGSSAGLNLWCDHYRHEAADGAWAWGDTQTRPRLQTPWQGAPPPLGAPLRITRRAGCDALPVDLAEPGEDLRLTSFIWADQQARLARLREAIRLVQPRLAAGEARIHAQRAGDFVRAQLAQRSERADNGEAFVLMHSVVWQYIAPEEQADITAQMQAAGAAATAAAPLAWLRFEPPMPDLRVELRLKTWPGGEDRLLARCHPHGAQVEWLGERPGERLAASAP